VSYLTLLVSDITSGRECFDTPTLVTCKFFQQTQVVCGRSH